jgi:hypothetical protein
VSSVSVSARGFLCLANKGVRASLGMSSAA